MESTTLMLPEKNERAIDAVGRAQGLVIVTSADYTAADEFCAGLKDLEREVDMAYDEHINQAYQAHRALVAKKKKYAEPIQEARTIVKQKMDTWRRAEEQKRLAAEAVAREASRKAQEDLALKAAAAVEQVNGNGQAAEKVLTDLTKTPIAVHVESSVPRAKTRLRERWVVVGVDESKLPDAYFKRVPDLDRIKTLASERKVEEPIPGVTAKRETY